MCLLLPGSRGKTAPLAARIALRRHECLDTTHLPTHLEFIPANPAKPVDGRHVEEPRHLHLGKPTRRRNDELTRPPRCRRFINNVQLRVRLVRRMLNHPIVQVPLIGQHRAPTTSGGRRHVYNEVLGLAKRTTRRENVSCRLGTYNTTVVHHPIFMLTLTNTANVLEHCACFRRILSKLSVSNEKLWNFVQHRIASSVTLTLQCASAVYHSSGTRIGTGGFSGEFICTEDSSLSRSGALNPANFPAKTTIASDGATVAL